MAYVPCAHTKRTGDETTMADYPDDLRYTKTHVWVRPREKLVTVGITQFAADGLGRASFLELPYPGELFKAGDMLLRISGENGSSAIYMPLVGQVNAVNQTLGDAPGQINEDPYGAGWLVRIEPNDVTDADNLMDAAAYAAYVSGGGE
jgi:glycine cleavage system H protein